MKKLVFLFLMPLVLFAYEDFGKIGFTYKIKEENFLKTLKKGIDEIDIEKIKGDLKRQVVKQATGEDNLSMCKKNKKTKEFDYVTLPEDIYTPTGRLYQKKGTKVTAYMAQPLDICFVDGTNMTVLENQVDFFDKETKNKCIYMVSNRNIMEVYKKWPERNRQFYPSKKRFEDRFKVKCNPTRVHLIHNDRIKSEFSIDKFKIKEGR